MTDQPVSAIDVSLVVPVYRSEAILPHLVRRIDAALAQTPWRHEIILVNDASPDDSWRVIRSLAAADTRVRGLSLTRNVGQHNATLAGLRAARGEIVVVMDDDLQHPPESIAALIDAIHAGFDVCYTHYAHRQHSVWKRLGSAFNDRIATLLLHKPPGLYLSSFKALHRRIVDRVIEYDGPHAYIDGLILDITRHIHAITIEHQARHTGEGNYNLRRSVSLWLKMVTSFSIVPLRIASVLGLLLTALSVVAAVTVAVRKWLHPDMAAGWASMIITVLLVGGIQTFCLGMVGEYLGRAYLTLNRKPQYVVRERTD